jgi:epoxyqueuosine reductase
MNTLKFKQDFTQAALDFGFSNVRFIAAEPLLKDELRFLKWRAEGNAAQMSYLKRANPINARPQNLLKEARTLIMLTADYAELQADFKPTDGKSYGRVAAYATGKDYHKVLKRKIKDFLCEYSNLNDYLKRARFFTDAVPLLEKSFARAAGLGFIGKNSLLISRTTGSNKFILEIITDLKLPVDEDESLEAAGTCGACQRCAEICPSGALDREFILDARKCLSYWNIETQGKIPAHIMAAMGEWLFGCDLCQQICPYNRKVKPLTKVFNEFNASAGAGYYQQLEKILIMDPVQMNYEEKLASMHSSSYHKCLKSFKSLTESEFCNQLFFELYGQTPLSRVKRLGLIRNALIVATNLADQTLLPFIKNFVKHESETIKYTADWALEKLN